MKYITLFSATILVTACSSASPLSKPAREVNLVSSMPAGQPGMRDLGQVTVEESRSFDGDEEDAKDRLRDYAARDGATTVLVQQQGRHPCEVDSNKSCVFFTGRKYRADSGNRPSEAL